ncbi:MAG: response regulator transcription factor, partial [Candidatus Acidiferrales bacterium]
AELPTAVSVILSGGAWTLPHLLKRYQFQMSSFRSQESRSKLSLTGRENQVFEMLVRRFSNKEIAEALGISERTIKFHVSNIFHKLRVKRRAGLVDRLLDYPSMTCSPKTSPNRM